MVMGVSVAVGVERLGSESPVVRVWNRLIANRPTTVVILYVGQKDKGFFWWIRCFFIIKIFKLRTETEVNFAGDHF